MTVPFYEKVNTMNINETGLNLIKSFEGLRLEAYKCPAGVWTIGYGHTGSVDGCPIREGMFITEEKATKLLKKDLEKFEKAVQNCSALTFVPNENQFSALVSFAYNCGAGNLKTLVKDRSAEVVAEKMLLYNKAGGKVLNGLIRRREAERELFLKGVENMAVKIGHASIDERGKITGGVAGDQKAELCTRTWYSKPWGFVLRPRSSSLAEWSARACEDACANKNIGYDQNQRNTLYTQALKVGFDLSKITVPCECDCSSLMHVCALAGGANITYGSNGAATSTMKSRFTVNGEYEVLTDKKYLTSDKYLKRGDILVKAGSHTVMVLENGSNASNTSTNTSTNTSAQKVSDTKMPTIKIGSKGKAVKIWQIIVGVTADGEFGSKTAEATIKFQKAHGLVADGIVGAKTWKAGLESV